METCPQCRSFWNLARFFGGAATVRLAHAPTGWVEQAAALARRRGRTRTVLEAVGRLVFDSWASPATVGLLLDMTLTESEFFDRATSHFHDNPEIGAFADVRF